MVTYERLLDSDPDLAIREGGMHFEGESAVHKALRRITSRLEELGIPYALAGGMALFLHGYRRFTEDVDLVVTADGLKTLLKELIGHGYRPAFQGSKNLRDTEHGVRIEFLIAGQFPGDGRPKPVSFPEPEQASITIGGIRCLNLERLIELKIASGAQPDRLRDLADVLELIRLFKLPSSYGERLDASVRPQYADLWNRANSATESEE